MIFCRLGIARSKARPHHTFLQVALYNLIVFSDRSTLSLLKLTKTSSLKGVGVFGQDRCYIYAPDEEDKTIEQFKSKTHKKLFVKSPFDFKYNRVSLKKRL